MGLRKRATRPIFGPDDHGRAVSAEEFAEAVFEEPWTYEREDGRLLVMAPDERGQVEGTSPWLESLVGYWRVHPEVVELVVPRAWVRPNCQSDRVGDLGVYLLAKGPALPSPDRIPELVFNIISQSRSNRERDFGGRCYDLLRHGVREYIIVDRPWKAVTVFTRGAGDDRKRVLRPPDEYASPLLPGLTIPLAEVL